MSWDMERAFDLLRSKCQRAQIRAVDALLPTTKQEPTEEQRAQLMALVGVWRWSWYARLREGVFDLFRDAEERRRAIRGRALLVGDIRAAEKEQELALSRLDKEWRRIGENVIDLSRAVAETRNTLGLPATGAVRGLPGVTQEVADYIETVDSRGGKVRTAEALELAARLNPQGTEAAVLAYRKRKAGS